MIYIKFPNAENMPHKILLVC